MGGVRTVHADVCCALNIATKHMDKVQETISLLLQVCNVTCCGIINFEQHCTSKKHLRKAAAVAHATVSSNSLFLAGNDATPTATASTASDGGNGTTYVGIKAQCRTYCKQVCVWLYLLACMMLAHVALPPGVCYQSQTGSLARVRHKLSKEGVPLLIIW